MNLFFAEIIPNDYLRHSFRYRARTFPPYVHFRYKGSQVTTRIHVIFHVSLIFDHRPNATRVSAEKTVSFNIFRLRTWIVD